MSIDTPALLAPRDTSAVGKPSQEPYLKIRPDTAFAWLGLREAFRFRGLMMGLAQCDLKLRYRQTFLGVAWVVLQPLLAAGIFTIVFGKIAKLSSGGVPYFLLAYAGQLGWSAFSNTLGRSGTCLVGNANLISKIYFPRLVLPFSTVLASLVDFAVMLVMMAVLLPLYKVPITPAILLLPLWLLLTVLFGLGLGLMTAAAVVTYRDVGYVVPVLTQFLMYASPVGYALSQVPKEMRGAIALNPLTALMEGFRWSLLGQTPVDWLNVGYATGVAVLAFLAGAVFFHRTERRFADVI